MSALNLTQFPFPPMPVPTTVSATRLSMSLHVALSVNAPQSVGKIGSA